MKHAIVGNLVWATAMLSGLSILVPMEQLFSWRGLIASSVIIVGCQVAEAIIYWNYLKRAR